MTFSSAAFLFLFLPVIFFLYYLLPSLRAKNILLTIASVLFYAFGEPVCVLLLFFSVTVNYFFAIAIDRHHSKVLLAGSVIFNLLLLGIFKYAAFAVSSLNVLPGIQLPIPQIALPIGISFYTFQILSYVVDVWRGDAIVQRRYCDLLLYISFFPQLIAGPIVKYHDIDQQIAARTSTPEKTARGVRRFLVGLAKKLLLANTCGMIADTAFQADSLGTALAWLGAVAYCLQIYHDFSGYSDMAIGLGAMFGFDILENFDYPYISGSIKEFWRRWHISLSTWFKEYIYIPLGGNRVGSGKMYRNKLIVFFTTGLWHGAGLNFILWGLWHGAFSILEDFLQPTKKKWLKPVWRLVTLFVVLFGFVLFRADTMADAVHYITAMFTPIASSALLAQCLNGYNLTVMLIAILFSLPILPALRKKVSVRVSEGIGYAASVVLLIACLTSLASSTFNPFIYFRF